MKYYIIDYNNWKVKFHSVLDSKITNESGVDISTAVLYGFFRSLPKLHGYKIFVALDGTPAKQKYLLPSYKGNRDHEQSMPSIPTRDVLLGIKKIAKLNALDLSIVFSPNQEADQVISSLTYSITGNCTPGTKSITNIMTNDEPGDDKRLGYINCYQKFDDNLEPGSVVIGTTDADMYQLMTLGDVKIDSSTSGTKIMDSTPESVSGVNIYGVLPYKCLFGDHSDNIPALDLQFKKKEILDELNLFEREDAEQFYRFSSKFPTIQKVLDTVNRDPKLRRGFQVNYSVARLGYFGNIYECVFVPNDYDNILKKYKIKY